MTREKRRIAFVLYSDPMIYPPIMNAAAILTENGISVDIFCKRYETGERIAIPDGVRLIYHGSLMKGIRLRLDYVEFCAWLAKRALKYKYDWVFAYNMMACFPGFLSSRLAASKWVYYNLDITSVHRRWGFYTALKWLERHLARYADLVVFPQERRAAIFAQEAHLRKRPLIVMNGPRRNWGNVRQLDPEVSELRRLCGKVVLYQGGLNWKRGLRQVIESMAYWDPKVGLCLAGSTKIEPTFPGEARQLASALGVEERLLIRSIVAYARLPRLTRACDVGLAVMATVEDDASVNIRFLAGASNKLVEYMACGLPVVVPDTEEYRRYIGESGLGILVDSGSPRAIAQGINSLLKDKVLYERISARITEAFRSRLNYDAQFAPIIRLASGQ